MIIINMEYNQADQCTHCRSSGGRRGRERSREIQETLTETSRIWGKTCLYKSSKLNEFKVGKTQRLTSRHIIIKLPKDKDSWKQQEKTYS